MKTSFVIAAIGCVFILAAIMVAGCTQSTTPSPATTTVAPSTIGSPAGTAAVPTPVITAPPASATTAPASPGTSVQTLFLNSTASGEIVTIPAGERVLVRLNENPTTGYSWNATASKGLSIIHDAYTAPNTTLVGAGGYHDWILAPDTVGTYTFKAVYLRPWEGASPTDEIFSLVIVATPE